MTNNSKNIQCSLCGSLRFKTLDRFVSAEAQQVDPKLPKQFVVHKCQNCNVGFVKPTIPPRTLKSIYQHFYANDYSSERFAYTNSPYDKPNWIQEKGRLDEIERFAKPGSLIDIGAGPGHFLFLARQRGWQVYGQEIAPEAAAIAKKNFGLSLHTQPLNQLQYPDRFFDVITFHAVIEHVPQPTRYIRWAVNKIKPGGLLVVSFPNLASLNYRLSRLFNVSYPGFIFEHLHYFTPKTARFLLSDLDILEITSFHHSRLAPPKDTKQILPTMAISHKFLRELKHSTQKIDYVKRRAYFFQMRILREFMEYNRWGGKLVLGDVFYVFAQKPIQ